MIYIIDTDSWVVLSQSYPIHLFGVLWKKIGQLIREGKIQSPEQVKNEIKTDRDDLFKLFKNNNNMFRRTKPNIIRSAKKILLKYPCLVKPNKQEAADPFIIALAQEISGGFGSAIIVTQENQTKECRIPYVARQYKLEAIKLLEFFEREGWNFNQE